MGGIGLNREKPAELFYDNLMMGTRHAASIYRLTQLFYRKFGGLILLLIIGAKKNW